tara:strand:- start:389 stop:706 length:318 start_codon:yes stop_codon:yes gene_type:complete
MTTSMEKDRIIFLLACIGGNDDFKDSEVGHRLYATDLRCFKTIPPQIMRRVTFTTDYGTEVLDGLHLLQVLSEALGCKRPKYTMNRDKRAVILTRLITMKIEDAW